MDPNAARQAAEVSDEQLWEFLCDPDSMIAPRRGEYLADVRLQEIEDDGLAGEVIFPQMAPFGAGLMQYRHDIPPEHNLAGIQSYNRWLADFCGRNPGRHAGVALINVDDIAVAVAEIRQAHKSGLFGGVLLPVSTGQHPYYHNYERYAPIWAVCEELDMPIHTHSGWSPDYGDAQSAIPMFITEVDMWAQRVFPALLWAGVFERHPALRGAVVELGAGWVPSFLRRLDWSSDIWRKSEPDLQKLDRKPSEQLTAQMAFTPFVYEDVGQLITESNDELYLFSSDYPHHEGGRNPLGRFERSLDGHTAESLNRFYADNFGRVFAGQL